MKKIISIAQTRWCWLAVAIALIVITTANVPVKSAESIDPDATQILQSMSSYMNVIGRPATPGSVAGVSRRTSRRVIRRSTIYVASLPTGCSTVVIEGSQLYQCGASYYQSQGSQYVVVYVD